jgi:hypothetical protein
MDASTGANELDLWHNYALRSLDGSISAITNEAFDAERT